MNKFELFTLTYFWLDSYYKDETDEKVITLLSDMNPFLWEDIGSADPAVYEEFCSFLGKKEINLDNSLSLAREYIDTIDYAHLTEAFHTVDEEEWKNGCKRYLSMDHKGADASD